MSALPLSPAELADLASMVKKGVTRWHTVRLERESIRDCGLWLENGEIVRAEASTPHTQEQIVRAIYDALVKRRKRHKRSAQRAAVTRAKRRELKVYRLVEKWLDGDDFPPSRRCRICGRHLSDDESIERGIGTECWQGFLQAVTETMANKGADA